MIVRRLPHEQAEGWAERPPATEDFAPGRPGWAEHKPYWIGRQGSAAPGEGSQPLPAFTWHAPDGAPLKRTGLYDAHRGLGAKIVPFAGWEMPVQYASVQEEHLAVRQRAGLFDVSHMGLFEFSGENVQAFLNTLCTNDISLVEPGGSQYSFMLAPDGSVVDDAWIYRLGDERYWMVVNAANTDKDWAWINAVRQGGVQIDARLARITDAGHRDSRGA